VSSIDENLTMILKDIGEFGLIDRILRRTAGMRDTHIVINNGDDAFAARIRPGYVIVATTDMLSEGVHFSREWNEWESIGYKAIAVNISDLAAMGAVKPLYCLVSAGLPANTPVNIVDKIFTGMLKACKKSNILLMGGDTVKSQKYIVISITLVGEAKAKNLIKRSGAVIGDKLLISGHFGCSRAGLEVLRNGIGREKKKYYSLVKSHLLPPNRLLLGKFLGNTQHASSLMDSSDGLACSVQHMAKASRVGFRIHVDRIPIAGALRDWTTAHRKNPFEYLVHGGEEYELIFTACEQDIPAVKAAFPYISVVGDVVPMKEGILYIKDGKIIHLPNSTFQHFS
jgi:thiamine-monophosphate kinase